MLLQRAMDDPLRRLLHERDEADAPDHPRGFDQAALVCRAREVERRLNRELAEPTVFVGPAGASGAGGGVTIGLGAYAQAGQLGIRRPALYFSNFGDFVTIGSTDLLPDTRLEEIVAVVSSAGFVYLREDELDAPYDGVMGDKFVTWWNRYFAAHQADPPL